MIRNLSNESIIKVNAGESFGLALSEEGNVYSWGINSDGQLGHGHRSDIKTPKKIDLGFKAVDIACGDSHSLVLSGSLIDLNFSIHKSYYFFC